MTPIRIDRMQKAFFQLLSARFDPLSYTVGWADSRPSFETIKNNWINLYIISGPNQSFTRFPGSETFLPPAEITLTVTSAVEGVQYLITLNEVDYIYDVPALATVTTIRDAILALLVAEAPWVSWTAASSGADAIVIASPTTGIWQASFGGPFTLAPVVYHETAVMLTRTSMDFELGVQAYSKNTTPATGAMATMARIKSIFQSQDFVDSLWSLGVGFLNRGNPVKNITFLKQPEWYTGADMSFVVSLDCGYTIDTDFIESGILTIDVSDTVGPLTTLTVNV